MAWKKFRLNKKFVRNLRDAFGNRSFTTKDSYEIYRTKHWQGTNDDPDAQMDGWGEMNCRNSVNAAVAAGVLWRVAPRGVFVFRKPAALPLKD